MQENRFQAHQVQPELTAVPPTLAEKVLENLQQIPVSESIKLMPEQEFNPEYLAAVKVIFGFLVEQFPDQSLDPQLDAG